MTAHKWTRDTQPSLSGDWKKPLSILCSGWYACSMPISCPWAIYLRHSTTGPQGFSGSIGKERLVTWSEQPVSSFESEQLTELNFNSFWSNEDQKELNTDQRYLLEMCNIFSIGECSIDLAMWNSDCLNHSRWLKTANRILWLYVSDKKPSDNLKMLVT